MTGLAIESTVEGAGHVESQHHFALASGEERELHLVAVEELLGRWQCRRHIDASETAQTLQRLPDEVGLGLELRFVFELLPAAAAADVEVRAAPGDPLRRRPEHLHGARLREAALH